MSDHVGQQLGNYQLLHLIGRGNFADVYLGEHLHLNTLAAVKVLHTRLTHEESEKLRTEARTMARLAHPHIIRVLEFGVEDSIPFLIMEYAPNGTLRQSQPKGTKVPLDIVVSYVKQVADALQYIHSQKLIHRDVKPETMVLERNNEILLSDFGIAIIAQSTRSLQIQPAQEAAGSVTYMAPEQLMGKPRPASDQYALAVVTYEWLSGEPPFLGSVQQIANQHLSVHPPPLSTKTPAISSAVEQVVLKALEKDPQQRFASVVDFALALEEAFDAETAGRTLFVPTSGRSAEREQRTPASRNLPTGTVTLLFTDIEESTHMLQQLGDRYGSLLAQYRQLLQASFQEWNGYVVDSREDAFSVAFARPTDAVVAVVEVQRAIAAHPWPEGAAVHARIGLHTGEPALTSEGYVGLDVHRAERIMRAGHGGQVLLSQTTAHLVEQDLPDDVNLRDLGEHRLKNLGRPKRLFQLEISGLPADFPPLETLETYPNNLPVQLTPFIGRELEVTSACDLLLSEEVHLLALTGPGGTGKTRLALQVAAELSDRFADGVFFVNLAPISDPALVVSSISETLGIRERADQSLLERLKEHLHQQQMLLLLDNFEQVVSAAVQVMELLVACPQLKVMVTSREVPHVRARHEFAVPPLPLPDLKHLPDLAALSHFAAVALFISRAQAVKPDFQMTATNARAIAEICARLDGLPLAIELAAARIKLLPPQALLVRIGQRLDVLTSTSTDVPARQQSLRNTITWSYELLTEEEQRLFRRLSVFVGGCTLDAIEAVCAALDGGAGNLFEGMASLLDKSLLQQTEQDAEEPRLIMLETIREYGLEALAANGELQAARQAHALYFLALAEQVAPNLQGREQGKWLARLEQELDNSRAALTWLLEIARQRSRSEEVRQQAECALRLCIALFGFWDARRQLREAWTFLKQALAVSEDAVAPVRAKALYAAVNLTWIVEEDNDRAETLARESLALYQQIGDREGIATSLRMLGGIARSRSQFAVARSQLDEAEGLFKEARDAWGRGKCLTLLGQIATVQGEYALASTLLEESRGLFSDLGDQHEVGWVLILQARMLFLSGGLAIEAQALAEQGLGLVREIGDTWMMMQALNVLGQIHLQQGEQTLARELFEACLETSQEQGESLDIAEMQIDLARILAVQGEMANACALYQESLVLLRKNGDEEFIPACLEGLANIAAAQGEPLWAARLWGRAETQLETYGMPLAPIYRADYEQAVAAARTQLGEKAFAAAWSEGRTMSLEQVLAAKGIAEVPALMSTEPSSNLKEPMPSISPAGLTTREMEVLRLLAQGLTSAQIAEQLAIGLVTVNSHVRSIYSKLGVTSRAAATRYALEHKLL